MNETTGRSQDDFEKRLFAMIDAGELDFPKGAVRPGVEAAPSPGLFERLGLRGRGRLGLPRLVLTAAVVYAATFTLSLPVYRALFAPPSVPAPPATIAAPVVPPPPSVGSAQTLALGAGPTRASAAVQAVTVGASDSFLVLSFLVPIREGAGLVRTAAIHDASGRVLVEHGPIQSADDLGNFVLVCNARLFTAGDYALVVTEATPAGASAESHRFSFQVVRPRP